LISFLAKKKEGDGKAFSGLFSLLFFLFFQILHIT